MDPAGAIPIWTGDTAAVLTVTESDPDADRERPGRRPRAARTPTESDPDG